MSKWYVVDNTFNNFNYCPTIGWFETFNFRIQVLDDEAEVFVVKMWRLLVYEIEAKKIGLASKS